MKLKTKKTAFPLPKQAEPQRLVTPISRGPLCHIAAALAMLTQAPVAWAFEVPTSVPDLTLNWDTTVKYSAASRVGKRSDALITGSVSAANQDDGDRNFSRGLISNRLDLYSEADLRYGNFGARVSAAGWYDSVYNRSNDNTSPGTSNNISVPYNAFPTDTRDVMGRKAEVLDAFVFGKGMLGDVPVNIRLGKHALQWGESLFFGGNAIAGAMAPLDIVKAALIPNSLVREIVRPVGQLSGTMELTSSISLAAYYQYQWDKSRLPPAGSYFSPGDILDAGGECLRLTIGAPCNTPSPAPRVPPSGSFRTPDVSAKDSGQFGVRLKYSDKQAGFDYGLYALRFHAKTQQVVTTLSPFPISYKLVYPEGIKLYGASLSFNSGPFQWSAETSTRRNAPLVGGGSGAPGNTFNNSDNPAYAVGNTAHAQVALLATSGQTALYDSAAFLAEVAWNRVLSVTRNPQQVSVTGERDSWAFRMVFSPSYNQVINGLDISLPVGLGYSPKGKSLAISQFATDHGGDLTIGVSGTYLAAWQFSMSFRHFFGTAAPAQDANSQFTYKQSLRDRDFVSLSVSRTF